MKFPLPELSDSKFTMCVYPLPDAPIGIRKHEHFIDNGVCHGCEKTHVRTCKVGDLPNLCQPCYNWMKKYSHMDDPYHIKRIKTGTPIDDELVKKAIRYAKVKTMDAAGVVGMSTGAILLHAYKAYKDALEEGASEEEARAKRVYIEQEDELWRQAELEEEVRVQEHRQELLRKMRENQRIIDAQQARLNRLSGKNAGNRSIDNIKSGKQEVCVKVSEKNALKQMDAEIEKEETEEKKYKKIIKKIKQVEFTKKEKVYLAIIVVMFLLSQTFRYIVLISIVGALISVFWYCVTDVLNKFK